MATLPEFDILRRQARQQSQAAKQEGQQALKRRFARIGGLGSGAFIKQSQLGEQAANEQAQAAQTQIGLAEQQQKKADEQTAIERAFRERQQSFAEKQATEQAQTQKEQFQQQFEAQQEQFAKQFGLTKEQADIDKQIKLQQLDQAKDQFELDKRTQIFNQFSAARFDPRFLQRFLALYDSTGEIPSAQQVSESLAGTDRAITDKKQTSDQEALRRMAEENRNS